MKIVLTKDEVKDIVLNHVSSIYYPGVNTIELEVYSEGSFATLGTVEETPVEEEPFVVGEVPF